MVPPFRCENVLHTELRETPFAILRAGKGREGERPTIQWRIDFEAPEGTQSSVTERRWKVFFESAPDCAKPLHGSEINLRKYIGSAIHNNNTTHTSLLLLFSHFYTMYYKTGARTASVCAHNSCCRSCSRTLIGWTTGADKRTHA